MDGRCIVSLGVSSLGVSVSKAAIELGMMTCSTFDSRAAFNTLKKRFRLVREFCVSQLEFFQGHAGFEVQLRAQFLSVLPILLLISFLTNLVGL